MIPTDISEGIRSAYHSYAANTPGFVHRDPQKRFISVAASTISRLPDGELPDGHVAPVVTVQGKTGTGKTIAYLLATIVAARAKRKKVVVSTATVALQQQLFDRDIPSVQEKSGLEFTYALAKGRQRFVCLSKLAEATSAEGDMFDGSPSAGGQVDDLHERLEKAFNDKTWDGDKDSWPEVIASDRWSRVSTDSSGCSGSNCGAYHQCPFYQARKEIVEADLIVANHDLVLSSLKHGGTLPESGDCVYVFDEAHHLPQKAMSHSSYAHRVRAANKWIAKSVGDVKSALTALYGNGYADKAEHLALLIDDEAGSLKEYMNHAVGLFDSMKQFTQAPARIGKSSGYTNDDQVYRFAHGEVPADLENLAGLIEGAANSVLRKLEQIKADINEKVKAKDIERKTGELQTASIGLLLHSYKTVADVWGEYQETTVTDGNYPMARWITKSQFGNETDYMVSVSPISAAPLLKGLLWEKCAAALLTSATLTAMGKFDRFADMAGLTTHGRVYFESLESTFDYQKNAEIVFPRMKNEPSNHEAFTDEVTEWFADYLKPSEATLALFTSYRQMNAVLDALPPKIRRHIAVQGDMSNRDLIEQHKKKVDAGQPSILFGVDSLAEGVDLKGKYLTLVVIVKLPFGRPDDPVGESLSEFITRTGGNPFMQISVPDAAIKLVQAVGRLCRQETDQGRVVILDKRLLTKRYGKDMMLDLPPMRQVRL